MEILVACEESQTLTIALRNRGHVAFSCDVLPCSGGHPEWHLQCDIFQAIASRRWDRMFAFPPCTDLATSGAKHFPAKIIDGRQQRAVDFFLALTRTDIPVWAIENPVGVMSTIYRQPNDIVNPYDFGDAARKRTCFWTKGLPRLRATSFDAPLFGQSIDRGTVHVTRGGRILPSWYNVSSGPNRARVRSKTFQGIANAIADQWTR
jgi:hypothetical protein